MFSEMLNTGLMKTIEEIYRENLQALAREFGGVANIAAKVGCSPSQYSQWMNGSENSGTGKPRGMRHSSARRIEKAAGKPLGWMDKQHEGESLVELKRSRVVAMHPDDEQSDEFVYVPESRIEFAGGNGRVAMFELVEDEEPATYRRSWFQKYGINPERVRRFRVSGDSMEPMLYARDTILVNEDERNVVDGKMYAIRYGDELRVKYLSKRLDGTLLLRSVNPAYAVEEVPPDLVEQHISIIGRVRDTSGTGGL